jgi:hypothetical protein
MNAKILLCTISVPSTDFTREAYLDGSGISPTIRFSYKKDDVELTGGIEFHTVVATRTRAERSCTVWHIDAYDTLVEIQDSSWVAEIRADTAEQWRDKWPMHHYMICLDSVGCFEVVAESWVAIPGETASERCVTAEGEK